VHDARLSDCINERAKEHTETPIAGRRAAQGKQAHDVSVSVPVYISRSKIHQVAPHRVDSST
jgi:hypothetical protein